MLLQVHRGQKSVCPSGLGGGLKIHCTQVRMGPNPIADTVLSRIRWVQLPGSVVQAEQALKAQHREGEFGDSEHSWGSA